MCEEKPLPLVRLSREQPLIYSIDLFLRTLVPGTWQEQSRSGSLLQFSGEISTTHTVSSRATLLDARCSSPRITSST